ncbi:hypothetical protein [Paenibacillus radicis (ex Xue et al. 2023)]|uniref:VCBS repeat-containing protein n=1 Tax=Paenibacillus radicis (ex Xue et al. 2023) TaxID=2972489 RepID=A0ABT1YD90_9BACL|nr:hypothetical protein [Paenibacillus radicis (ex Xue et al. 2023)]MCR8631165.1 hypothetical protein [Paenibacillus radicis (ex Xue et al. 2023)]
MIQNALPPGASLVRPKKSKTTGSIFVNDLDRDGILEAIVYYQASENNKGLTGMLWQQKGDTWKLLNEFQGEGYELDTLMFDDVTDDGSLEVIAGYSGGEKVAKGLIVYRFDGHNFNKIFDSPYTEFVVDDLNEDNKKDLSILTLERNASSSLTVLQYSQNSFQTIGATPLDSHVSGYYSVQSNWIAESKRGILLDAGIGAHSAYTQLVYFEQGNLIKAFPDKDIPLKPRPSINGDFNHDGIVEIGMDRVPTGWENEPYVSTPWITAFYRWDSQKGYTSAPLYELFMDIGSGFYFEIPVEWNKDYQLQRPKDEGVIRFIANISGETVEWKTMSEEAWVSMQPSTDWLEIGRTAKTVTALHLTEASLQYSTRFRPLSELVK